MWNAAALDAPAHIVCAVASDGESLSGWAAGGKAAEVNGRHEDSLNCASDDSSDDEAWRMHLGMQNGGHTRPNGVPASPQRRHSGGGGSAAWLSPELALNLGLACHLQPFLQPGSEQAADGSLADGGLPAAAADGFSIRRQPVGLDAVVIEPYVPQQEDHPPHAGASTSISALAPPAVSIAVPDAGPAMVQAATAVTLAQVREPEPNPLPAEGDADDAAGGEPGGGADPSTFASGSHGHSWAGPPGLEHQAAPGGAGAGDDAGFGDALTAALRRHFQVVSHLRLPNVSAVASAT